MFAFFESAAPAIPATACQNDLLHSLSMFFVILAGSSDTHLQLKPGYVRAHCSVYGYGLKCIILSFARQTYAKWIPKISIFNYRVRGGGDGDSDEDDSAWHTIPSLAVDVRLPWTTDFALCLWHFHTLERPPRHARTRKRVGLREEEALIDDSIKWKSLI